MPPRDFASGRNPCGGNNTLMIIESFRFEDKNDASTGFTLTFLRVFKKNIQPGKLHCTVINAVIFIGEGLALSRSQNN